MKKLVMLCAALVGVVAVNAQTTWGVKGGVDLSSYTIGLKGTGATVHPGNQTGFYIGLVNNIQLSTKFGIQTELQYAYEGLRVRANSDLASAIGSLVVGDPMKLPDLSVALHHHNLRLPIMVKYQITERFGVMAGPYLNYRVGSSLAFNDNAENLLVGSMSQEGFDNVKDMVENVVEDNLKKFDVGATMGAEYNFCRGLFIDARYSFSFLNSMKDELDLTSISPDAPKFDLKKEFGIEPRVRYHSWQIGVGYRF